MGVEAPLSNLPALDPSRADGFSAVVTAKCMDVFVPLQLTSYQGRTLGNSGITASGPPLCFVFKQNPAVCFTKSPGSWSTRSFLTCTCALRTDGVADDFPQQEMISPSKRNWATSGALTSAGLFLLVFNG